MGRIYERHTFPFHRGKVTGNSGFRDFDLPMATGQAHSSHLPDIRFFGDFSLAHCQRARRDGPSTLVASVSGKAEVLLSHGIPSTRLPALNDSASSARGSGQ